MSALGQTRSFECFCSTSAWVPQADFQAAQLDVAVVPFADIPVRKLRYLAALDNCPEKCPDPGS
jgi:hypothetical protein